MKDGLLMIVFLIVVETLWLATGCTTAEKEVGNLGGKEPVACMTNAGSAMHEDAFSTCRDAAGVIFVCNRDNQVRCIRIDHVQARWSAGLPEARP